MYESENPALRSDESGEAEREHILPISKHANQKSVKITLSGRRSEPIVSVVEGVKADRRKGGRSEVHALAKLLNLFKLETHFLRPPISKKNRTRVEDAL